MGTDINADSTLYRKKKVSTQALDVLGCVPLTLLETRLFLLFSAPSELVIHLFYRMGSTASSTLSSTWRARDTQILIKQTHSLLFPFLCSLLALEGQNRPPPPPHPSARHVAHS